MKSQVRMEGRSELLQVTRAAMDQPQWTNLNDVVLTVGGNRRARREPTPRIMLVCYAIGQPVMVQK